MFFFGNFYFLFWLASQSRSFQFQLVHISSNTNRRRSANTTAMQPTMIKNNEIVTQISTYSHQLCLIKYTHKTVFMFSPCSFLQAESQPLKIWIFKLLGDDKLRDHKTCGWICENVRRFFIRNYIMFGESGSGRGMGRGKLCLFQCFRFYFIRSTCAPPKLDSVFLLLFTLWGKLLVHEMIIQIRNSDRLEPNTLMYSFVVARSNFVHPRTAIRMDAPHTATQN